MVYRIRQVGFKDIGQKELFENAKKQLEGYKGLKQKKELEPEFFELLKECQVPHLKEGIVGKYKIEADIIPTGKEMVVVSMRNWLMMGYKPLKVRFTEPRLVYKLKPKEPKEEDTEILLMSDTPQEMFLQYEAYNNARGRVLVGGLGLGVYANMIAKKKEVSEVIVVEIEKDIIKLCKPKNKKIKVIEGNIWDFIKKTKEKFDYIYIDVHYSTGAMEYIHTILPMRKILRKRFPIVPVDFWGEEEMKAQYNPNFKWKDN